MREIKKKETQTNNMHQIQITKVTQKQQKNKRASLVNIIQKTLRNLMNQTIIKKKTHNTAIKHPIAQIQQIQILLNNKQMHAMFQIDLNVLNKSNKFIYTLYSLNTKSHNSG
eukprot:NODE_89_length_21781_cov_0.895836.p24 type:complete len:112 gc:universal NODE_89_length_21781_cov_0.895836:7097-6762(-)